MNFDLISIVLQQSMDFGLIFTLKIKHERRATPQTTLPGKKDPLPG